MSIDINRLSPKELDSLINQAENQSTLLRSMIGFSTPNLQLTVASCRCNLQPSA